MRWNRKRSIFKNHRNCLPLGLGVRSRPVRRLSITRHWNWMNSYLMFWIGRLRGARSVSSFCDFLKNYLSWFNHIFLLFEARKSCVFLIFLLRSIKAYLCPNMINFDSVDFSERRPEEVISFFWRSVYNYADCIKFDTLGISWYVILFQRSS